jgi:hypothetical protein
MNLQQIQRYTKSHVREFYAHKIAKAVPLHAMEAIGGRESIAPTHS